MKGKNEVNLEKDQYLTTKAFAELCGVEKRTLFYYDEIGLLKPAFVYKRVNNPGMGTLIKPSGTYYNVYLETEENAIRPLTTRYLQELKNQGVPVGQKIYIDEISGDFFKFGHKKNIFRFSTRLE